MATEAKTCRSCLVENGADIMFSLSDPDLRSLYQDCTTIVVPDNGPQLLCKACRNRVLTWERFKKKSLESEIKINSPEFGKPPKIYSLWKTEPEKLPPQKDQVVVDRTMKSLEDHKDYVKKFSPDEDQPPEKERQNDSIANESVESIQMDTSSEFPTTPKKKYERKIYLPAADRVKRETPSIYKYPGSSVKLLQEAEEEEEELIESPKANKNKPLMPPEEIIEESTHLDDQIISFSIKRKSFKKNQPIQCPFCNSFFTLCSLFKKHFEEEHENDVLPIRNSEPGKPGKLCLVCSGKLQPGASLLLHTVAEHMTGVLYVEYPLGNTLKCLHCKVSFASQTELEVHQCVIWCSFCKKSYHSPKFLLRHIREKHNQDPPNKSYPCLFCKKEFSLSSNRKRHSKICKMRTPDTQSEDSLVDPLTV